jgi:hypothetical protein
MAELQGKLNTALFRMLEILLEKFHYIDSTIP